jgi:hypothetical protein
MFFIMRLFFYVRVNAELQTRSTSNPEVSREHLVERVVPNALARGQVIGFGTSRSTFNPEVQANAWWNALSPTRWHGPSHRLEDKAIHR